MISITCFFIGWNIQDTVAMTVRHYLGFCDRVVYLDNHSEDLSREIAKEVGAEVRTFGVPGVLDDSEYTKIKNNVWKGCDSDYVIVVDDDEIVYHPYLKFILKQERLWGTTIFNTQGFSIFSENMPHENWLELKDGVRDNNYSKSCIFSPTLNEISFVYGCHVAKPSGVINQSKHTIPILHYRAVGGAQRLIDRQASYVKRLSEINKRWGLGGHYLEAEETKLKWFSEHLSKAKRLDVFLDDKDGIAR